MMISKPSNKLKLSLRRNKMGMSTKITIHRITEIKISEMQRSKDMRCYWRDVIFVDEHGEEFEVTAFPVEGKTIIPVCPGD